MEGVERLHLLDPLGRQEAFAERRHAEVDDGDLERGGTEATRGPPVMSCRHAVHECQRIGG